MTMKRTKLQFLTIVFIWLVAGVLIGIAIGLTMNHSKNCRTRVDIDTTYIQTEFEDTWGTTIKEEDL